MSIAFFSLIISIWVAYSNRKTLHVDIYEKAIPINSGEVYLISEFDGVEFPSVYGDSILMKIEIVNSSPKDIAFFDLRCFDTKENKDIALLTRRTMLDEDRKRSIWRYLKHSDNISELIIPNKNYGVLKSGTFTRLDILVFPNVDIKEIGLSFKVAKKAIVKDKFTKNNRKEFKFYGTVFDIHSWTEKLSDKNSEEKKEVD